MNHVATHPDGCAHAILAYANFKTGNEQIRLHRRPTIQKNSAAIHLVPVINFLLAHFGWELRVLAQLLQTFAFYTQRHTRWVINGTGVRI